MWGEGKRHGIGQTSISRRPRLNEMALLVHTVLFTVEWQTFPRGPVFSSVTRVTLVCGSLLETLMNSIILCDFSEKLLFNVLSFCLKKKSDLFEQM